MSRFTEVLVSVQKRGAADPRRGHLTSGLLVGPDVVMVPTAQPLTGASEVEVLLSGTPAGTRVERIAPKRLVLYTVDGQPEPLVGYFQLASASRHEAGSLDGEAELSRTDTDMWPALERAGAVPRGFRGPSKEQLTKFRPPAGSASSTPLERRKLSFDSRQELERRACPWKFCDVREIFAG